MTIRPTPWKRTGDCRIVPWYLGLMRAEFCERRDFIDSEGIFGTTYQLRWVRAGRFPAEFDGPSASGFWSTLTTPIGDTKTYGDRSLWRAFITYFRGEYA